MLYSILYPGIVQYGQGQEGKGIYLGSLAAAGAVGTLVTEVLVWRAREDVEDARRDYWEAAPADRHDLINKLHDQQEDRDRAVDRRAIMAIGTGAVWGVSLLDAVFFSPDFRVRTADRGSLTLGMERKTRLKAVARSLLFPGLGQEYNGESTKSAWIATGGIAAGLWLMHRQDEYAEAVAEYNKAHRRFIAARTVEESEEYAALQEDKYSRVEDRKTDRNVAIAILGAYWGVAALETVLSFGNSWGDQAVRQNGRMGLAVDPMEGAVAAQWKF
jgi:hypothetical protein